MLVKLCFTDAKQSLISSTFPNKVWEQEKQKKHKILSDFVLLKLLGKISLS
jgi:hypothetical protein